MSEAGRRPLSFTQSVIFGCGNFGANVVYSFLNGAAGLYLNRYPEVPTWAVGLLAQERSLAGAVVQPIVGALIYLAGFPPIIPMLLVLSINAFFLNVAVDPYMALLADLVPIDQRGRVGALLAIFNMLGQIAATVAALSGTALRSSCSSSWRRHWSSRSASRRSSSRSRSRRPAERADGDRRRWLPPRLAGRRDLLLYIGAAALPQALVAMGVIGLANGVWTSLAVPLLRELVPQERAAEMTGLGSAVWSLAQPIGAVFAGLLIASADNYRISFVGAAVFIFLCFVLLLFVHAPAVRRS